MDDWQLLKNYAAQHSEEAFRTLVRITPHLNDALERLSAADQELVMMRFFGNKSHKDVANALGVSEQTARKRISRAIERLREIFTRRGVVVSSLALASAFSAHGVQAVPMELAASWAKVAIAKAASGTAATTGAGGILPLLTSAKATSLIAAVTGLVVLAVAYTVSRSLSHGSQVAQHLAIALTTPPAMPETNKSSTGPVAPSKSARDTGAIDPLAAALDKVKAALHDPNQTTLYPNSAMQEAIAGLGDHKKAALPILEATLSEANAEVRLRAIDGLAIMGPEAKEAAPLLLGVLRDGGLGEAIPQTRYARKMGESGGTASLNIYTDTMLLYALGQIHPAPEILPEFARSLKESRSVCQIVYRATRQFPGVRRSMQAGGWLWAIANENSDALNAAFRPLLQDPDPVVRRSAALSLVSALGDQADAGVFSMAIELLKSGNDGILRGDAMSLLEGAARDPRPDSAAAEPSLTAARLGPFLNETVSALADVAAHSTREDLRLQAAKLLDVLSPDFRKSSPALAAGLEQQDQSDAFISKVGSGEATMTEVLEGLKRFPKAAPAIAGYYARSGSNAVELLPAFTEALSALAPSPEASPGDRTKAINARQLLADNMQRIAPELPKPIFTGMDTLALRRTMRDPVLQADPERLQKVSDACNLADWPDRGIFDVRPDAIHRLLAAMKDADAPTYDALVAKVKEIDPHFSDLAVGSSQESGH